jgi:hypothetical protein
MVRFAQAGLFTQLRSFKNRFKISGAKTALISQASEVGWAAKPSDRR